MTRTNSPMLTTNHRHIEVDTAPRDSATKARSLYRRRSHDESTLLYTVLCQPRRIVSDRLSTHMRRRETSSKIQANCLGRIPLNARKHAILVKLKTVEPGFHLGNLSQSNRGQFGSCLESHSSLAGPMSELIFMWLPSSTLCYARFETLSWCS